MTENAATDAGFEIRVVRNAQYATINTSSLEDPNLSLKAKGLHTCLQNWKGPQKVSILGLASKSRDGKDAVQTALNELVKHGYIWREWFLDDSNLRRMRYLVFEVPQLPPHASASSASGFSASGKSVPFKDPIQDHGSILMNTTSVSRRCGEPSRFAGRRRVSKVDPETLLGRAPDPQRRDRDRMKVGLMKRQAISYAERNRYPHNEGKGKQAESKPRYDTSCPKRIKPALEKWMEVGVRHTEGTKVLWEGIRALKQVVGGTFFASKPGLEDRNRAYTVDEVVKALRRFDLMRNSPDCLPHDKTSLRRISLARFFYNPHVNGDGYNRSLFLKCLDAEPRKVEETDPEFNEYLLRLYREYKGQVRMEPAQFSRATKRIKDYFADNGDWLKRFRIITVKQLGNVWFETVDRRFGGSEWEPHHLTMNGIEGAVAQDLKEFSPAA